MPFWLISIGAKALGLAKAARDLAVRHPLATALAISLLLNWFLLERGNRFRDKLIAVGEAQADAGERQAEVNRFPVLKSKAIAERSEADATLYYAEGRRAGLAYADAHRVRGPVCPSGPADMPGTDHPAPLDDGTGDAADMVAVSRPDFELLVGNSLRLAKVHQDAQSLIEAGVAVPLATEAPAFPVAAPVGGE